MGPVVNMLPPRKLKPRSIPKVRKKPRRTSAIKCRPHINWVLAEFICCLSGHTQKSTGEYHYCEGPLDPHHVVSRGAGGGDEQIVPLCRKGHNLGESPNWSWQRVEEEYGVDLTATAAALWEQSPAGRAYRRAATEAHQVGTRDQETLPAEVPQAPSRRPSANTEG